MDYFGLLHPYAKPCMRNSRLLTFQRSVGVLFQMLFWVPVAFFSLLLIYNTLPYFSFSREFIFIEERILLFQSKVYSACFYVHIAAGSLCIGTALIQFSRYILKKSKAIPYTMHDTMIIHNPPAGSPKASKPKRSTHANMLINMTLLIPYRFKKNGIARIKAVSEI